MKHQYDEPTMQAAIDAALPHTLANVGNFVSTSLDMTPLNGSWEIESHVRLHLLKSALDLLPEPPPPVVDGKTPGQVGADIFYTGTAFKWKSLLAGDKALWEKTASAVLAAFGSKPAEIPWTEWRGGECPLKDEEVEKWEYRFKSGEVIERPSDLPSAYDWSLDGDNISAYRVLKWKPGFGPVVDWRAKFEAQETTLNQVLETVGNILARAEKAEAELARVIEESEQPQLSTLRPISEAGPVPAGCVRVYEHEDGGQLFINDYYASIDTHFADIRLPAESTPEVIHDGGEVFPVADPYAELKSAHAKGKVIEWRSKNLDGSWINWKAVGDPKWYPCDEYRIKSDPSTFEAHGKTWTRHTPGDPMPCDGKNKVNLLCKDESLFPSSRDVPAYVVTWDLCSNDGYNVIGWRYADEPTLELEQPWTPAVGDVVTLRSGGPNMTVLDTHPTCFCSWFTDGEFYSNNFPAATLIPA